MLKTNVGKNSSERNFGLDIVRAVAIMLVVFGHGSFLLTNTCLDNFPYIKMIDGVDLFFVLSGFLIGGILLKEINSESRFGFKELTQFWKRRWFRTLPNYYLILLVNYLLVHSAIIHEDIHQFSWKFLFFLQNFSSPFIGFFWESWSLSVEEWFYLSSPLLLVVFLNFLSPKKSFLLVTILMMVFPVIYRVTILNPSISNYWYDQTFRKVVISRLDSIAYGLFAAWFFYYFNDYWKKFKIICLILGIGLIIFIVNHESPNATIYKQLVFFTITPFSAMLLLPFAQSISSAKGLIPRSIAHISKISYSMYLINLSVVAEVIRDNFAPTGQIDGILKYLLYWIIVIAGSTVLFTYFEKPVMNLRDRKIKFSLMKLPSQLKGSRKEK
jgi:peptidoglycan/LPS O-acetylase OafA/YrhL